MSIEKADKAANIFVKLIDAVQLHPYWSATVVVAMVVVLCFLPGGVVTKMIERNVEMRKLDDRVGMSRKKLTSGRQNKRKN